MPFSYWYQFVWIPVSEFGIVVAMFAIVTMLGFLAMYSQRAPSLHSIDEWGLGGRRCGTWVTWFLLGGDLYTACTFVAVPYTIVVYPIVMFAAARMWSVSHRHGYATAADFVRAGTARLCSRYWSRSPASSPRCPKSRCGWPASRRSWR
jgi:hypothetical protein